VVIPCFNDGATIACAVESSLDQEPCEVVVVDDGSTDEATKAAIRRLSGPNVAVVLRPQNGGPAAARTSGVLASSAPYVFPLDADDCLLPGALTPLADLLDSDTSLSVAWGDYCFAGAKRHRRRTADSLDPWSLTYYNDVPTSALIRRDALCAVDGWSLHEGYEDWDLWMALVEAGYTGRRIDGIIYRYRIHGPRAHARFRAQHDRLYRMLGERHARLFNARARNWRASPAPLALKCAVPVIDQLPRLTATQRMFLFGLVAHTVRGDGYVRPVRRAVRSAIGLPPAC
jgi:glycosyltransferase involved in cell wall biosynthesis